MIRNIQITEAGSITEPVTVANFKEWANISYSDHDNLITRILKGARQTVEKYCHIALVEKDIVLYASLDGRPYELPYGPVSTIDRIASISGYNTETNLVEDETYYMQGSEFRTIYGYTKGLHVVEYTVGYTSTPEDLKEAVLAEAIYRYQHRGDERKIKISETAMDLATPYIRIWL